MDEAMDRRILIFCAGVEKIMRRDVELFQSGDRLPPDGTVGVRPAHQLGKVGSYGSGHPAFGGLNGGNDEVIYRKYEEYQRNLF